MLFGDGKGGFGESNDLVAEKTARVIVAADFNGDGKTDLATANDTGHSVSVFLGGSYSF